MANDDTVGETSVQRVLESGDLVGGYRIERLIGEGGIGEVYLARHTLLPRRAAVKVLHASLSDEPAAREGLLREAAILESMIDSGVTRLYDAGVLADGRPWIAMELVDGECLADLLGKRGLFSLAEAASIVRAIIDALNAAHTRGTVHGDVKPENVILRKAAHGYIAKLIDWGVAQRIARATSSTPCGTPQYMSPEQLRAEPLDAAADVYALGVVAFELITGQMPFSGRSPFELGRQHLNAAPPAIRTICPEVPPAIEALILGMMAKARDARPSLEAVRFGFSLIEEAGDLRTTDQMFAVPLTPEVAAATGAALATEMAEVVPGDSESVVRDCLNDTTPAMVPRPRWTPQELPLSCRQTQRLHKLPDSNDRPQSAVGVINTRSN
jgi:serine/threonine-protein kinase